MSKINFQLMLDERLKKITEENRPRLLLHCCCAPCSSYVLEYLSQYMDITCYYYNPNISTHEEYQKRPDELLSLIERMPFEQKPEVVIAEYDPQSFLRISEGKESLEEGGERCFECYKLRLEAAAKYAAENSYDLMTTSLSISPHKNATKLNEIGAESAATAGIEYLYSDFKKKGGYLRSCQLSEQYGLYRQDYCGCIHSKNAAEKRKIHD